MNKTNSITKRLEKYARSWCRGARFFPLPPESTLLMLRRHGVISIADYVALCVYEGVGDFGKKGLSGITSTFHLTEEEAARLIEDLDAVFASIKPEILIPCLRPRYLHPAVKGSKFEREFRQFVLTRLVDSGYRESLAAKGLTHVLNDSYVLESVGFEDAVREMLPANLYDQTISIYGIGAIPTTSTEYAKRCNVSIAVISCRRKDAFRVLTHPDNIGRLVTI